MSDCCSQDSVRSGSSATCPVNGKTYSSTSTRTLLHQISKPWLQNLQGEYFYCTDPDCDVVYFNQSGQVYKYEHLRASRQEQKTAYQALICHCFDISVNDISSNVAREQLRAFVIEQTRNNTCACSVRNPSGKCCLKDFK